MPHKWEEQEYGGGAIAKVGGVHEILGGISTGDQNVFVAVCSVQNQVSPSMIPKC